MFISGSAVFLILNGIDRFFRPHALHAPELGVYVSLFAIVVTLGLVMFQKHVVRVTGSQAIAADSLHYQTDLYMNAAIMVALGLSYFGVTQADAVFAIGIGVFILYSAFKNPSRARVCLRCPHKKYQRPRTFTHSLAKRIITQASFAWPRVVSQTCHPPNKYQKPAAVQRLHPQITKVR